MPQSDSTVQSVYERCDPAYLRELREAAGMDIHILARNACLSASQVRALESEKSGDVFYSDTIKRQAYKRVLLLLGAEPPQVTASPPLHESPPDLAGRLASLDTIAEMAHRPPVETSFLNTRKSTVAVFILMAGALAGMVLYKAQHPQEGVKSAPSAAIARVAPPVASDTTLAAAFQCAYRNDTLPRWTPIQAKKEGRYVYFVSSTPVDVCVVDGQKRATHVQLKAGESRSVYGSGPWQISSPDLQKIKVYFQGTLVMFPEPSTQALSLVDAPVTP